METVNGLLMETWKITSNGSGFILNLHPKKSVTTKSIILMQKFSHPRARTYVVEIKKALGSRNAK